MSSLGSSYSAAARFRAAFVLLRADLRRLAFAGPAFAPALFFILAGVLFAIGAGGDNRFVAPVFAVLTLFAAALALNSIFEPDQHEERVPVLAVSVLSFGECALVRILLHFVLTFPGLAVALSLLFIFWGLPFGVWLPAVFALGLACISLSALAAWVAALLLGARRGVLLLGLVFLPLATPVLILLAAVFSSFISRDLDSAPVFQLLGAAACFYAVLGLNGTALALRASF
ncbi:MAG: heme exporter protein CcmB [Alphaproteobacteria bacterium]|nr:heme exporter protein CcmB [Alphaproteobacteria bacterium]MDA7983146.1 heme exporter protein CcmB [Alphaproteobacteria bacterium]MDA8000504.1 heme exporter protein CcmB [Alphaproteobacteria bacterium]MDA8003875.1 heme exporter protein CcmB [Alphaproteobacteria bacterium]MDA8005845.1 heme exporter protein CcmB [Alphaproteobacteria bacterium]